MVAAPLCAGAPGHRSRNPARPLLSRCRQGHEAARRCVHQAHQDDHRTDHLLHGRGRHRRHGGHEEGRQDRCPRSALFRGRQHALAADRAHHRQCRAARRRHEHQSGHSEHESRGGLRQAWRTGHDDRLPDEHHPEHGRRRVCQGRNPAGAVLCGAVWLRPAPVRRSRHACVRHDREDLARAVQHRRVHHEGGADRRVRRHGVHHWPVRGVDAAVARLADGHVLRHMPCFRVRRARRDCGVARLQHLEIRQVHQGRAADRPGHVVVGGGPAADARQDGECRGPTSPLSGW